MGTSFFERYAELCKSIGESPNSVAKAIGASSGSVTAWKNGTDPRFKTLSKIADYFGVSVDYLLGKENERTPTLTKKDERDIARDVERIMEDLSGSGELMFDGVPMSEEAKAAMAAAMRIGFEEARRRNKATYTPKKYREE